MAQSQYQWRAAAAAAYSCCSRCRLSPRNAHEASTWRGAGATCTSSFSTRTVCPLGLQRGASASPRRCL
eukprot:3312147-Prymnesium_polylepis.1